MPVVSLLLELSHLQLFEPEQHAVLNVAAAAASSQQRLQRPQTEQPASAQRCDSQNAALHSNPQLAAVQCQGSQRGVAALEQRDDGPPVLGSNGAAKLPAAPSQRITYHLQVTMLDGEARHSTCPASKH